MEVLIPTELPEVRRPVAMVGMMKLKEKSQWSQPLPANGCQEYTGGEAQPACEAKTKVPDGLRLVT